jgi:hypothetical protein
MNFRARRMIQLVMVFYLFHSIEAKTNNNEVYQDSTWEIINEGANLFDGSARLANGGASCITCHNVVTELLISGGLLAKDLTNVYTRMGDGGISAILGSPPFPAMASTYRNREITSEEITRLKAFLQHIDQDVSTKNSNSMNEIFLLYSPFGLIVWLVIIYFLWFNRKKESVKKEIFDRQIKPIN